MTNSNGIVRKIRLGDDISTHCGKCKEDRLHQVIALSGAIPEKVQCKTCRGEHRYRAAKAISARKTATGKAGSRSKRLVDDDTPPTNIRDYSTKEIYATGSFISHPKFGLGRVIDARLGKIDVRFGSDMKTLLHAG